MSQSEDLAALGVSVQSARQVEADVAAAASAAAISAEDESHFRRQAAIAVDLEKLHKLVEFEQKKDSPCRSILVSLQHRIDSTESRRRALLEAYRARCEIASKTADLQCGEFPGESHAGPSDEASATIGMLPGESKDDFDIRTGKITPFQRERGSSKLTFLRRRKRPESVSPSFATKRPRQHDNDRDMSESSASEDGGDDKDPDFDVDRSDASSSDGRGGENDERDSPASRGENDDLEVVILENYTLPANVFDRLFDYQKTGLRWLMELHNQQCGGVLADEMGLGKTVQIVSFLASMEYSNVLEGPTIVVAPATVLKQWARELRSWWARFNVRILHHSSDVFEKNCVAHRTLRNPRSTIADVTRSGGRGVLVTSYEQLRKHQLLLLDKFEYVILDEGHKIRNPDAEITLICKRFQTPRRILLTGTPMQNNLKELWSLFDFVFPGRLGTLVVFETQFSAPIAIGGYANASRGEVYAAYRCAVTLKDLVAPYLLRRMKRDVSIDLPEKEEQVLFCRLSDEQRDAYKAFLSSRTVRQVLNGSANLLLAITTLRKICNHVDIATSSPSWEGPKFIQGAMSREDSRANPNQPGEEPLDSTAVVQDFGAPERSGKLKVLETVLATWRKSGSRALLFTQTRVMLSILENFAEKRSYSFRRMDGQTPVSKRMELMDEFNEDKSIFLFLLSTRVGGLGTNLTGADRVVLVDPDWNPSTDMQARERAWRIGQTKSVVVYRLVTSGTIEEKILQRQVYKSLLSSKVLSDPRQRRFFKKKDMKDLFTLTPDHVSGTETGDLFAGTDAREVRSTEEPASKSSPQDPGASKSHQMLTDLFNDEDAKHVLQSAMNHDDMMNAGHTDVDTDLFEHEAERLVTRAVEEVQRSARERHREAIAVPTWTGKSGLAGIPLLRSTPGALGRKPSILNDIKKRQDGSSSRPQKSATEFEDLVRDIISFLRSRNGSAPSDSVVAHFNARVGVGEANLVVFKAALKRVAIRQKRRGPNGDAMWILREVYKN